MYPRAAGLDETLSRRQCGGGGCCGAIGCVALDGDSTAEGALPADRYGLWDFVGGIDCVVLGVVDVAHCVEYVV